MGISEEEVLFIDTMVKRGFSVVEACRGDNALRQKYIRYLKKRGTGDEKTPGQKILKKEKDCSDVDVTAEMILVQLRRAIYRAIHSDGCSPKFFDIAIKLCEHEIDEWNQENKNKKSILEDYRRILEDVNNVRVEKFSVLKKEEDGTIKTESFCGEGEKNGND